MRIHDAVVGFLLVASIAFGAPALAADAATGSLIVTVNDSARAPLTNARVQIEGASARSALATNATGTSTFALVPGLYRVVVAKGGFSPASSEDVAIVAGTTTRLVITLSEATSTSLREIGRVTSTRQSSLNTGVSSVSVLSGEQLSERANQDLNRVITELPGVTLNRGSSSPNSYFVVRGGYTETRVEIDGHPVSTGVSGTYNSAFASSLAFSSIEVTKGAGLFGPGAGESAFGTINLRTADFRPTNVADVTLGLDSFGGQYSSYMANLNLLRNNRLSVLAVKTIFGSRGPADGTMANHAFSSSSPLINYQADYSARQYTASELIKARYRFSPTTSLTTEYLGLQGGFLPQGSSYGTFIGNKTIAACLNGPTPSFDPATCSKYSAYNAPIAQGLVGQTVPLYSFFPNSTVQNNEPIFSAELRTSIRNDTLLLRPYRAVINRFTDGAHEVSQPGDSGLWYQVSDPARCQPVFAAPNAATMLAATGPCFQGTSLTPIANATATCSVASPCYTTSTARDNHGTLAYGSPFSQAEQDRLAGVTFSYIHPVAQNIYTFGYEYSADNTNSYTGDISPLPAGVNYTVGGGTNGPKTPIGVPPTTSRKSNFSLTGQLQLTPQLQLGIGNYFTVARLDYQIEDPTIFAANQGNSPVVFLSRSRTIVHDDPHLGFTYRPQVGAIYRFSAGSSITVPYAGQISGLETFSQPSPGNNNTGNFSMRNPLLKPETTVAYNLGTDRRLPDGGVLSFDMFHNTIHDVFVDNRIDYVPPSSFASAIPGAHYTQSITVNGPIERNYGLELSIAKRPAVGFGYALSATVQRAFLDQLPASLYVNQQSALINGAQLSGPANSSPFGSPPAVVPYMTGFGEVRFAGLNHSLFTLGMTYTSNNNSTYGPAYVLFNSTARIPIADAYQLQIAVDNISNYTGGTSLDTAIANAGSSQTLYGAPVPGTAPVFSSRTVALQPIYPRVIRIELSRRIGSAR